MVAAIMSLVVLVGEWWLRKETLKKQAKNGRHKIDVNNTSPIWTKFENEEDRLQKLEHLNEAFDKFFKKR